MSEKEGRKCKNCVWFYRIWGRNRGLCKKDSPLIAFDPQHNLTSFWPGTDENESCNKHYFGDKTK